MYSVLCYTIVGDERMCKRTRDRMWSRVNKKNIVNGIKILTYWSIVSGIIYVHVLNNAVTQRNRTEW